MADVAALRDQVKRLLPEIIEFRRELHAHPELSGHEAGTAARVAERLDLPDLRVQTGVGGHGVVVTIGDGSPCVALRADMDALPIQETTGLPWASQECGVMHACGHDFHTAWLLGTGLVLREMGLSRGSVKLIFQPAEEALGGALEMIAAGVLVDPPVEAICGAHVWPDYPAGVIGLRAGPNLAAAGRFTVTITGNGTHGALPHLGRDPIVPAAELVLALQALVTRRLDPLFPAVLSVCQFHAGSAFNIIPAQAEIGGTVRTVREEDREAVQSLLTEYACGIAQAHDCKAQVTYERGVPPTCTDPEMTALARECIAGVAGDDIELVEAKPSMGGEDFSYYLEHCPGALLWVGCGGSRDCPTRTALHDAGFIGAEECLLPAMLSLAAIALGYLERQAD
ncbi:MAG: amidohydrolase [Armatimonadetes bacterium]|nr:amidohydrolase [Armatimonadota bacterium]